MRGGTSADRRSQCLLKFVKKNLWTPSVYLEVVRGGVYFSARSVWWVGSGIGWDTEVLPWKLT